MAWESNPYLHHNNCGLCGIRTHASGIPPVRVPWQPTAGALDHSVDEYTSLQIFAASVEQRARRTASCITPAYALVALNTFTKNG